MQLLILADDLSGAADTGAPFAQHGFHTTIALGQVPATPPDVLVLSTNTRDTSAELAANANRQAVQHTRSLQPQRIYKKLDSALRGHPHAELQAIMAELGITKALIAPALPAEGRTTVGGRQLIHGTPLEDTAFGPEITTSNLRHLFDPGHEGTTVHLELDTVRQGPEAIARFLHETTTGIIVADAETSADLDHLAQAILATDLALIAGSSGLGRALAAAMNTPLPVGADLVSARNTRYAIDHATANHPILIIAGSRNQATANQVAHLHQTGTPIVGLNQHQIDDLTASPEPTIHALVSHLTEGRSAVLTTAGLEPSPHGSASVVTRLADIVQAAATQTRLGGVVLTGGDVAAAVLAQLGATSIELGGEIRPALPWGTVTLANGTTLRLATKAGSFGTEDALLACLDHLSQLGH